MPPTRRNTLRTTLTLTVLATGACLLFTRTRTRSNPLSSPLPTTSLDMAWRSSGASNAALITNLAKHGLIKSERVKEAMLRTDRAQYAPAFPYDDSPQTIGYGATISAPHMHAAACESVLNHLHPAAKILDVGSGSGYLTEVLAHLIGPAGRVIGVDHIQGLVDLATENISKRPESKALLETGKVRFVKGDGRKGLSEEAPFDVIHVGAAAEELHQELVEQLRVGGRMFIPVSEGYDQWIFVVDKKEDGSLEKKREMAVRYVPLTEAPGGGGA